MCGGCSTTVTDTAAGTAAATVTSAVANRQIFLQELNTFGFMREKESSSQM
jgi:acyl-coenzyme A thioesterase PaaI-like protein